MHSTCWLGNVRVNMVCKMMFQHAV
jgi:hypothetical protein